MRPVPIVPVEILHDGRSRVAHRVVSMQVNLFIFERFPQSFNEHIISPCPAPAHAQLASSFPDSLHEFKRSKLATLIGVDDFRRAMLVGGPQSIATYAAAYDCYAPVAIRRRHYNHRIMAGTRKSVDHTWLCRNRPRDERTRSCDGGQSARDKARAL